jgi:hypothetical protein
VHTVEAIKPNLMEAWRLSPARAGFSAAIGADCHSYDADGNRIRVLVIPPSRVPVNSVAAATAQAASDKQITDPVFQWLREAFGGWA